MAFLEVKELTKYFGGLAAVNRVNFSVDQGQIIGLIGPNGAGKTTILNLISGVLRPTGGDIYFENEKIVGMRPDEISKRGVVRTFQLNVLFQEFSVLENILMGFHIHVRLPFLGEIFGSKKAGAINNYWLKVATDLIKMIGLSKYEREKAKNLPSGFKRMLGLGIALGTQSKLLLLDELFTGMTESETSQSIEIVKRIREQGKTILLVEHNMRAVMALCEQLVVLNFGKKIAEGASEEIRRNKDVIEAYLGAEEYVS